MNIIIALDGADGTGKTTIAKKLYERFSEVFDRSRINRLKFPSSDIYERLTKGEPLTASDFLKDMDRHIKRQHWCDKPTPLVGGRVSILDRSFITTAVYQGFRFPNQPVSSLEPFLPIGDDDKIQEILHDGIEIFKNHCDLFVSARIHCDHDTVADRIIQRLEKEAASIHKISHVTDLEGQDDTERVYINVLKTMPRHRASMKLENHLTCIDNAFYTVVGELQGMYPNGVMKIATEDCFNKGSDPVTGERHTDTIAKSLCAKYAPLVLKEVDDV